MGVIAVVTAIIGALLGANMSTNGMFFITGIALAIVVLTYVVLMFKRSYGGSGDVGMLMFVVGSVFCFLTPAWVAWLFKNFLS